MQFLTYNRADLLPSSPTLHRIKLVTVQIFNVLQNESNWNDKKYGIPSSELCNLLRKIGPPNPCACWEDCWLELSFQGKTVDFTGEINQTLMFDHLSKFSQLSALKLTGEFLPPIRCQLGQMPLWPNPGSPCTKAEEVWVISVMCRSSVVWFQCIDPTNCGKMSVISMDSLDCSH